MRFRLSPRALAGISARHPWRTIAAWVVALVALVAVSGAADSVLTSDIEFTNNEESQVAKDLLEAVRGPQPLFEQIVVQSSSRTVDDHAYRAFVTALANDVRGLDGHIEGVTSFYDSSAAALVSADRHTTLVPAKLAGDIESAGDHIPALLKVLRERDGRDDFTVVVTGYASINETFITIAEQDLRTELRVLPVVLIVLLLVFGAVVAALLPMGLAFVAIMIATALAMLLSNLFPLSVFVNNIIFTIGLALGIDYSLLIVERFREERRRGHDKLEAIARTGNTASRTVLTSGAIVVVSLAGMLIVPTNIFRAIGIGTIFVAIAAVLVGLTLLPALLGLLGDRVNWLAVPYVSPRGDAEGAGGFWGVAARLVIRNPWPAAILSTAVLIGLAIPYATISIGAAGASSFPSDTDAYRAFQILDREFNAGRSVATEIVVRAPDVSAAPVAAAIGRLQAAIDADPDMELSPAPDDGPLANKSLFLTTVALSGDFTSDQATDAVKRLRDTIIPGTFGGVDAEVLVGGQTALNTDFVQQVRRYTPIVFAFVLGLSMILLLVVFRSLVVPIKAIIMNLLSVGAAYGALVLVFQRGFGAGLLGFDTVDNIEAWLPLFMFMILFGLSMDYHVFLLSRIRERYDQTHDNAGSVEFGLRSTANIITGAAAIMVAVFGGFAQGQLVSFQQMGFGIAFAILLDATVVRMILVPSLMQLLGDANWYLPGWLHWLPDFRVEAGAQRQRGTATAGD